MDFVGAVVLRRADRLPVSGCPTVAASLAFVALAARTGFPAVAVTRIEALTGRERGIVIRLAGPARRAAVRSLPPTARKPPRVVVDVPDGAFVSTVIGRLPGFPVRGVRTRRHRGVARIVVDLDRPTPFTVRRARAAVAVVFEAPGAESPPRREAPPAVPRVSPPPEPAIRDEERPTGFTGQPRRAPFAGEDLVPLPDRWRVGWPEHDRLPGAPHEHPYARGHWWDPYQLNVLKGDYPIVGQDTFVAVTARSDTVVEGRRLPIPSDVSSARAASERFFGRGELLTVDQNFILSLALFRGDAAFKPRDWEMRVTPVFNVNHAAARENGVVNIDPRRGTDRLDGHVALEELLGDYKIADVGPYYDTVNVRAGIQGFTSDFRGFLFTDFSPGVKLSGNLHANRTQWSVAYFRELEKDTNSGLNRAFADRGQDVAVANLTRQDFVFPGYATQLSLTYDDDHGRRHYDENGFLVRPADVGTPRVHTVRVGYVGWTGEGHIDRFNVSHAFFWALGRDDFNPIAGRDVRVNAQMAALELSYDRDWLRFKGSAFFASGDDDPTDGTAHGFDAILDAPDFAGGSFSFWQRQGIKLTGTNVNLVNRFSLLPTLRSSKEEGQQNFVNPGVLIGNVGVAGRLTPKLSFDANVNYVRFVETAPLELLLLQRRVRHDVGLDYGVGVRWRPLLIDNVIAVFGVAGFTPFGGFQDVYTARTLWQVFGALTLTY